MSRAALAFLVLVAVLVGAGCGGSSAERTADPGAVAELTDVEQLASAFDADRGKPRLVLLLSPT